jgi:hypothetical protein
MYLSFAGILLNISRQGAPPVFHLELFASKIPQNYLFFRLNAVILRNRNGVDCGQAILLKRKKIESFALFC